MKRAPATCTYDYRGSTYDCNVNLPWTKNVVDDALGGGSWALLECSANAAGSVKESKEEGEEYEEEEGGRRKAGQRCGTHEGARGRGGNR